jgi:GDP-L-fucose synthase
VGAAITRALRRCGIEAVYTAESVEEVAAALAELQPDCVFVVSGEAQGISANQARPADIMLANLNFEIPVLEAAHRGGVRRLMYLASSCCYPRDSPQPMRPEYLTAGGFEPSNLPYSVAKTAALTLCQALRWQHGHDWIVGIPATPFGRGDHFDFQRSHVVAALMRRIHEAKAHGQRQVTAWGSGTPRRDFIFAEDLGDACVYAMRHYHEEAPLNLVGDRDMSIAEIAELICEVVGFDGEVVFDRSKPDGAALKILDGTRLRDLGWSAITSTRDALRQTYEWYLSKIQREESCPK